MSEDPTTSVEIEQETPEQWRDIAGFPGYQVSTLGRVRSYQAVIRKGVSRLGWSFLKPYLHNHGYLVVTLRRDWKPRKRYVHRLVLEAFVGPCPPGMETRHVLRNDKADNRLENLRWGTPLENSDDSLRHGTRVMGHKCHASKLTDEEILELLSLREQGETLMALAARFSIRYENVWKICNRKSRKGLAAKKPAVDRRRKNWRTG